MAQRLLRLKTSKIRLCTVKIATFFLKTREYFVAIVAQSITCRTRQVLQLF